LTANPNGEAEVVTVIHRQKAKLKRLKFDFDFAEVAVKGRGAKGNILTKHAVNRIEMKEKGVSTLGARKVWFDEAVKRLNYEERGRLLGSFTGEDRILTIMQSGTYRMTGIEETTKFDDDMLIIEKWNPEKPVSAVYYEPDKEQLYIKRFLAEESDKPVSFISDHEDARLEYVSTAWRPQFLIKFDQRSTQRDDELINVEEFIAIKGHKALGNRLTKYKVKTLEDQDPLPHEEETPEEVEAQEQGEGSADSHTEVKAPAKPEQAKPQEETSTSKDTTSANAGASSAKESTTKKEADASDKDGGDQNDDPEPAAPKAAKEANEPKEKPKEKEAPKAEEKKDDKKKGDDDDDKGGGGFGAGSQITLEL
jgi:topoisomerase-4 subunit A